MYRKLCGVLTLCLLGLAAVGLNAAEFLVAPGHAAADDRNPGTPAKPLKTLARALEVAGPGDTILLGDGEYPRAAITRIYDNPLTIQAAAGARPVMTGGIAITKGGGVRLAGLIFTWPAGGRPSKPMTPFITITDSQDVEISACEIFDDPQRSEWSGWACNIANSERVTVRDSAAHHFYFGFSAYRSRHVVFRNLRIGPWTHEDGIRVTECEGPILVEGCTISNTGMAGRKGGHVDAIQVVYWTDNLTVRNCHIYGMGQGIGAFAATNDRSSRRRKNWRIEGNLIYDVYAPHACSIYECDGVTVVNNTLPQNRLLLSKCTNGLVRNNIFGLGSAAEPGIDSDYNLVIAGGPQSGAHNLVDCDPQFVSTPLLTLKSDSRRLKEMTRSRFLFREKLTGKLAAGDIVEVMNTDGLGRDALPRKVTAAGDDWIEVAPPLVNAPDWAGVVVFKWPEGQKTLVPDYHLTAGSPAIDSADSSVERGPDQDGHAATDSPGVADTGAGRTPYLDRGALEFVPDR